MAKTGLRDQLAAYMVEHQDDAEKPRLTIHGTPGDWAVMIDSTANGYDMIWLAVTRKPTEIRAFKTLDAAHNAADEIARIADPLTKRTNVRITNMGA